MNKCDYCGKLARKRFCCAECAYRHRKYDYLRRRSVGTVKDVKLVMNGVTYYWHAQDADRIAYADTLVYDTVNGRNEIIGFA